MANRRKKSRGYSKRKVNTREVRQRFLIVCEGTKTEPNYFKCFPVPKEVMDVRGLGENPSRLVDSAREIRADGDYDQVWCVFDRDEWSSQDVNNAHQKAQQFDINIAFSNEAFELWYVLHFEFLDVGIPRADYIKKLNTSMENRYHKNSSTIYSELLEKQTTAIKNAKRLLACYAPYLPEKSKPSTTVHLLVQKLNKHSR